MERLVEPDRLRARILLWCEEEARLGLLPRKAGLILEAILFRGELPGGDLAALPGSTDRRAGRIVASLAERGVLISESSRAPLRLAFPAALAPRWMPGLFPEKRGQASGARQRGLTIGVSSLRRRERSTTVVSSARFTEP